MMRRSEAALLATLVCGAMVGGCSQGSGSAIPRVALPGVSRSSGSLCPLTLYLFDGEPDAAQPYGTLVNSKGVLYGTSMTGGANNLGSIYTITPTGTEKVLYSFSGADGEYPQSGLTAFNGTFYGTTSGGGAYGHGVLFSLTHSGQESVLYSFQGGTDGSAPSAAPTFWGGGMWGTTTSGGANGYGTVYRVLITSSRTGQERVVYSFKGSGDGAQPESSLFHYNGLFYGTTYAGGGVNNVGTVFTVTTAGVEKAIHHFKGGAYDGAHPVAGLTLVGTQFFATTENGGVKNDGTVYKMYSGGHLTVIHSFGVNKDDGINPVAPLVDYRGLLYGTTLADVTVGSGTLYSIATRGTESVLAIFDESSSDGAGCPSMPESGVVGIDNVLYGTSSASTGSGAGTVYSVTL